MSDPRNDLADPGADPSADELARLRRDWQTTTHDTPEVDLRALRRRLSRRWLLVALEVLVLVGGTLFLTVAALNMRGIMEWIYWSFFVVFFVGVAIAGVRLRLQALWRRDDSTSAILEHAWRDATVREQGGAFSLWLSPVVWAFVVAWLIAEAVLQGLTVAAFFEHNAVPLAFVTVWCLGGAIIGALLRDKGRRQRQDLHCLATELANDSR